MPIASMRRVVKIPARTLSAGMIALAASASHTLAPDARAP